MIPPSNERFSAREAARMRKPSNRLGEKTRTIAATLLCALVATGCGPAVLTATASGPGADYEVRAFRHGDAVHLHVIGVRVSARKQTAFDNPRAWRVAALGDGRPLQRAVNGPTSVSRDPIGRRDWRVTVKFSVAFAMPSTASVVTVRLKAPGQRPETLEVALPP
jgi:hypothetical protein